MKTSSHLRYALAASIIMTLLAGCAASQPPLMTPGRKLASRNENQQDVQVHR